MKLFAALLAIALPSFSVSAADDAVKCDRAVPVVGKLVAEGSRRDSELLNCSVVGLAGLGLGTVIDSSLVQSRGIFLVRFEDGSGRTLWTWESEPFIGQFSGLNFQKVIPVPLGAVKAIILLRTEGDPHKSTGFFGAGINRVETGLVALLESKKLPVFTEGSASEWFVSAGPLSPSFSMRVQVLDLEGSIAHSDKWKIAPGEPIAFHVPPLPVGYYSLIARADAPGHMAPPLEKNFAVVATGDAPQEPRIGIDAALSWYGGQAVNIERALGLMRLAGVGSVRDRLRWSQVQPDSVKTEWGSYMAIAEQVAKSGFELVTTFHDSPSWTRGVSSKKPDDRQPPLDMLAVRRFGQIVARDMGKHLRAIEFWNEQNSAFFAGYPYQYANAMKAFSAGVKSVDPSLTVLIGAAAARPGQFFEESYRNNLAEYFDVRNQHYYGPADSFPQFFLTQVLPQEKTYGVDKKPGWLTEIGFSLRRDEHGELKKAEREQAVYLTKAYAEGFAAGYERVFFFFLRELIESNFHNWGILRNDFSPRPAYSALAALSRHIADQKFVAVTRRDLWRAMFWQGKDGSYSAIAWGGGLAHELLGSFRGAKDVFGRSIRLRPNEIRLGDSPILITGISKLPESSSLIATSTKGNAVVPRLRLSADVAVDGKDVASTRGNRVSLPVRTGAKLVIHGRVFSTPEGVAEEKSISLICEPGNGVKVDGASAYSLNRDNKAGTPFQCSFQPQLLNVGRSFVRVTASDKGTKDSVQLALEPDSESLLNAPVRALQKSLSCATWQGRASKNVTLKTVMIPIPGQPCAGVQVESVVKNSGETWVFPALALASPMIGGKGLRVEVEPVAGKPFPPTPLMVQIVDSSAGLWLIEMEKGTASGRTTTYSGLFSTARPAPWKMPKVATLNPDQAKEVMFGWGGFGGQAGQMHGFIIRTIAVIEGES